MIKLNKVFLIMVVVFFQSCSNNIIMKDKINVYIVNRKEYLDGIKKIKEVEKAKDIEFVVNNSKFLLNELEIDYNSLKISNIFFMLNGQFTKEDLKTEYDLGNEVLNDILNKAFDFDKKGKNYFNFDMWKEYYIKNRANVIYNDWFVFYNANYYSIELDPSLKKYFEDPVINNFLYNPNLSYDNLISKYYYNLYDLQNNLKENASFNTIKDHLPNNNYFNDCLVFWNIDDED